MNETQIRAAFESVFTDAAYHAVGPLLVLAIGVVLLLFADIVPSLRAFRPLVFLGTLAWAAVDTVGILNAPLEDLVIGGTFAANATTAVWGLIFLVGTALAWAYSIGYYTKDDSPFKNEHDALMLAAAAGMMLMVGARDLLVFFIGLELLSIPLYCLAGFRRARHDSIEAGLKYFTLGAFMTGFFLFGAGLVYSATGSLALADIGAHMSGELGGEPTRVGLALAGAALMAASLFFKASVFPFHLWVPDVYQGSPTPVTALMASGTKAAAFGFLIPASLMLPVEAAGTIAALALITMALGNLGALVQDDLKRMLAYSGVAHAGTLLLLVAGTLAVGADGGAISTVEATRAALFYMAAYVFSVTGAFGVLALLEADGEHFTRLENLRGLSKTRPGAAAALALFMLSFGGIPATGGFLGKWFVFSVLVEADMIGTAIVGALLSVVALGYYLRVIIVLFMQEAPEGQAAPTTRRPLTAGVATAICCAFVLILGIVPGWFLGLI